jgi:hypothetical protein
MRQGTILYLKIMILRHFCSTSPSLLQMYLAIRSLSLIPCRSIDYNTSCQTYSLPSSSSSYTTRSLFIPAFSRAVATRTCLLVCNFVFPVPLMSINHDPIRNTNNEDGDECSIQTHFGAGL